MKCAFFSLIANPTAAQSSVDAPPLRAGDKAQILFVASAPGTEKDEKGNAALASLDPVVFLVGGEIRDCATAHPVPGEGNVPKATIKALNRAYAKGQHYPVWWGGAPWGEVEAVSSCIEGTDGEYQDFAGCVHLRRKSAGLAPTSDFKGTVWTGTAPTASHHMQRARASSRERTIFLQAASEAFALHYVRVVPSSIHSGIVWKTQLQTGRAALAGSALVQLAAAKPKTYYSYRIFLVVEEDKDAYSKVLDHFRRTTIPLESITEAPKLGETLDEEGDTDKEIFIDNFPLFAGEPDAIITEHTYYESWAYSVYRRVGANYELLYTGCGGGT